LARENGVETLSTLGSAAGTDYIVLSLPGADLVRSSVPELLSTPGTLGIVDTTTSDPATSREMASLGNGSGTAFIDAPVSGGRRGAQSGRLSAFVGADEQALRTCLPVLHILTDGQFEHLGGPGAGNVVKLLNNVLSKANLVSVGEALA